MLNHISASSIGPTRLIQASKKKSVLSTRINIPRPPRKCMDVFDDTYQILKLKSDPEVKAHVSQPNNFKVTFGKDFHPKPKEIISKPVLNSKPQNTKTNQKEIENISRKISLLELE